jgi:hypothetical protein
LEGKKECALFTSRNVPRLFSPLKRLLSHILLILFMFHSVGSTLVFLALQAQVRREVKQRIKEGLPPEQLQVLSFSLQEASALDWKKEGHEFRYQGMMYDVVRVKLEQNRVLYHCITDMQEEGLFEGLDELVQEYMTRSSKQKELKRLAKNLSKVYQVVKTTHRLEFSQANLPVDFHYQFSLSTFWQDIPVPPPKLS